MESITIFLFAAMVAAFIRFLHYVIGSPSIDPDTNEININKSAIFSFYGHFIAKRYIRTNDAETRRIWAKYELWKNERIRIHEQQMNEADPEQHYEIINQLASDLDAKQNEVETWRRPNFWMSAGLCPICFGTWVSLSSWLFGSIAFGIHPGFIVFGIATSVLISNRIKL